MKKENIDSMELTPEARASMQREIEFLSEFMTAERYDIINRVVDNRTKYITVCLENTFYSQNASAIIRSCEAFGIQNVYATEQLCNFSPNENIVRGADKWVDIERFRGEHATEELVSHLKANGYRIVATSPHINGTTAEDYDLTKGKTAIFFGTEKDGISDTLKNLADDFVQIEMYGFMESFNVSVAASIVLNGITRQLHNSNIDWRLTSDEQLILKHRWMKQSVKDSDRIVKRLYSDKNI